MAPVGVAIPGAMGEEPYARIVKSSERGLSVLFLSNSPPREKRYFGKGDANSCVISVGSQESDLLGRKHSEPFRLRKDSLETPTRPGRSKSEEPSARIVLKGAIAFTEDSICNNAFNSKIKSNSNIQNNQFLSLGSNISINNKMNKAEESNYSWQGYVENIKPEAPPRRRRRNRTSSDSAVYIGEKEQFREKRYSQLIQSKSSDNNFKVYVNSEGDNQRSQSQPRCTQTDLSLVQKNNLDNKNRSQSQPRPSKSVVNLNDTSDSDLNLSIEERRSKNDSIVYVTSLEDDQLQYESELDRSYSRMSVTSDSVGTCSTSMVITLGGEDDVRGEDVRSISGRIGPLSDLGDTEDDSVFNNETKLKYDVRERGKEKCYISLNGDYSHRKANLSGLNKSLLEKSNQCQSLPCLINNDSVNESKSETEKVTCKVKKVSKLSTPDLIKNLKPVKTKSSHEKEKSERHLSKPDLDSWSVVSEPPPRRPQRYMKNPSIGRARSSSPLKPHRSPEEPVGPPRRSRSCNLFQHKDKREREPPKSLLDIFFEQGMESDLTSLPWDFKYSSLYQSMTALHLAAEGRDYLMWCPDLEFDAAVNALDMRGLVELVQTLQDAMAVEQQTFDSLSQQLEMISDPLQQQRLSAALCTSQTRLARLCSRNMRCFTQQALKARQKESGESRSNSPRDSGVAGSYASDAEDPRSPGVQAHSFRNSLAFFQKAATTVNSKSIGGSRRSHEGRRRSSRGSSSYSSSSEAWSISSEDHLLDDSRLLPEDDLPDQGHYEQVLFINGRPQYQNELRSSSEQLDVRRNDRVRHRSVEDTSKSTRHSSPSSERSRSWSRSRLDGSGWGGGGGGAAAALGHSAGDSSVTAGSPSRRADTNDEPDSSSEVTLPRRKPYLNFRSVSGSAINYSGTGSDLDNDDLRFIKDKNGISRSSNSVNTITRTQSFKEGLNSDSNSEFSSNKVCGLSRTQSFHDGLSSDFNEVETTKPKLKRVPSVDEILESVKSLRAKKAMVKSTPDLLNAGEPVYQSTSLPRHHKGSKGKAPRPPGTASLLGVRYTNGSQDPHYERVPDPDYEQIHEHTIPYYENVSKSNGNHYENIQVQEEVIYDSPRPTEHHYDKVHNDMHYENLKFDAPVYENINENEPTYMNVNGTKINNPKGNVYANIEPNNQKTSSIKSNKKSQQQNQTKITITGNSTVQGLTYDVPRAATHIYDSPQKQVRSVVHASASEYDTPKNNRSILPQSTQIVLNAKPLPTKTSPSKIQKDNKKLQKIDDIFAECDRDSLVGDVREREPDIPSPDYGSEEENEGYTANHNGDYQNNQDFPDEGLGESDARSFYTEDQGLEVILEEPEEEYCSSHVSEDDLRCDVDISHELKGERRSLDGSEGIGSAEGDTHSSGGSEHYVEEDCASSGIHSEDTPSPAPTEQDALEENTRREEDRTQKDRCLEVYPETLRQRQRAMIQANNKVDIKNWSSTGGDLQQTPNKSNKKFLPSVKALRNQFESGKSNNNRADASPSPTNNSSSMPVLSRRSSTSTSSLASSSLEKASSTNSLNSQGGSTENLLGPSIENGSPRENGNHQYDEEPVEPIFNQFKQVDEELRQLMKRPPTTTGWNPRPLLRRLYYVPEAPKIQSRGTTYVNIEGYLEKLPSGRKKATFWNAWKRRYFVAKDGVLYYYQNNQSEKPSMKMSLMGGKVECMEPNMIGVDDGRGDKAGVMLGIDDGKGHYVVVRCSSRQEAERWRRALETHNVEDFASQYVQPWPIPTNPTLLRDTLVVDLGSASVRAGVLASNPTLPQLFFPSVVSTARGSRQQTWGFDSLSPDIRANSTISFPLRPSHKISKYSVDLSTVSSLLQKTFAELNVDPKNYHLQISVPRILNTNTQAELLRILFEKFDIKSVNLTHQSILALYAYNATSGIVVDIGERMDIVPVIDGYIVDGGVSRVPYGGHRILDHLRQFLYQSNVSLVNEVESYIIRYVLENACYCAHHYNTERARCTNNSDNFEKNVSLSEFFQGQPCPYTNINVDFGRFQATEGLFNPDAWGLDHPGLHKLVHKAIQECSMDIRKEMSRSIFLSGGVSQLPGLTDRLTTELDNLTPPAIRPKVHASPYSYHAAYLGGCVLAESPAFVQSRITREDWNKHGNMALRKWSL